MKRLTAIRTWDSELVDGEWAVFADTEVVAHINPVAENNALLAQLIQSTPWMFLMTLAFQRGWKMETTVDGHTLTSTCGRVFELGFGIARCNYDEFAAIRELLLSQDREAFVCAFDE